MTAMLRRSLPAGIIAGLLIVIVVGLLPAGEPRSADQRVHEIASNIKCPACGGASIADANSSVAGDLLSVIREQVDSGLSDADIYQYFVARFTKAALLLPPTSGHGLWLWLLPISGLVIGVGVILRRRRDNEVGFSQPIDQLEAVARDLFDLDIQLASGEIDAVTGARLRTGYEEEAELVHSRLAQSGEERTRGADTRRWVMGATLLGVSLLVIALSVGSAIRERDPEGLITGDVVEAAASTGAVNLADITNEEMEDVIARFPDNVSMRRALANRYFFAQEYGKAFDHYWAVLQVRQDPVALANIGWITYMTTSEIDTALGLVERSLIVEPDNPLAYWYLANIRFVGFSDPVGAVEPLIALLAYSDVPDELRNEAQRLLDVARAAS